MSNAVSTTWPSGSANGGWPQEPTGMLMPGRIQGWPAGTQRAANPATTLLSQAVAWWDVEQYREGDSFLRNRGTGGELLDLRLGSAAVANSNEPRFLSPEDSGYVFLPGVASNFLSVPDENALDIVGDIDIRCRVALDSWAPATQNAFLAKRAGGTAATWSYEFHLPAGSSRPRVQWYDTNASTSRNLQANAALSLSDGQAAWVRVTLDVDNGASGVTATFYTAPDGPVEPTTWTQLGDPITGANVAAISSSSAAVEMGTNTGGTQSAMSGRYYRAIIKDGIDGTTVLDIDCDAITSGSTTSWVTALNQTVTVNRSTSGRKSVAVPSRHKGGRPVFLHGTDDYMSCVDTWQTGLLNFTQNDELTVLAIYRSWGTPTVNGSIISRGDIANTPFTGWQLRQRTTGAVTEWRVGDADWGGTSTRSCIASHTSGGVSVTAGRAGRFTNVYDVYVNGTQTTPNTGSGEAPPRRSYRSLLATVVGGNGVASYFADMEFYGAAIFRRALSAAEIKTLSDYFAGRIA